MLINQALRAHLLVINGIVLTVAVVCAITAWAVAQVEGVSNAQMVPYTYGTILFGGFSWLIWKARRRLERVTLLEEPS